MSATGLTPWTLRIGNAQWPRLTGERASSAKSVFTLRRAGIWTWADRKRGLKQTIG